MKKIIFQNERVQWMHFESPGRIDIETLREQFAIHPIILEELLHQSDRGKIEIYDDYIFIVYPIPIYDTREKTSRKGEIDFVVSKNVMITVSYEPLELIQSIKKQIMSLDKEASHAGELLYHALKECNVFSLRELRHVEEKVKAIGGRMFRNPNIKLLEDVSYIKRDLLDLSLIANPERTVFESLAAHGPQFFGAETKVYFSDLLTHFMKTHYVIENLRAMTESYSITISQIFQFRTSEVMRKFSILGFLTFPLVLYVTVTLNPRIEETFIYAPFDFWVWFGIITVIVIGLAIFFRKKRWL